VAAGKRCFSARSARRLVDKLALNDNSVRVCAGHFRKGGIKPLVRSGYRNWLNLNASSTAARLT